MRSILADAPSPKCRLSAEGFGDVDGDGRPEIVIVNMNETPSLLKNTASQGNYLALRLTGTKSNRSAIGSRVTVDASGRRQSGEVMSWGQLLLAERYDAVLRAGRGGEG